MSYSKLTSTHQVLTTDQIWWVYVDELLRNELECERMWKLVRKISDFHLWKWGHGQMAYKKTKFNKARYDSWWEMNLIVKNLQSHSAMKWGHGQMTYSRLASTHQDLTIDQIWCV